MAADDFGIDTPRLLLRVPRAGDLDGFAALMADEESAKFIGGAMPRSTTWRGLMTLIGSWHSLGFTMFSVIERSTGEWIGRVGPWMPEGWPGPEVGWAIRRDRWGSGYAPEAAIAATSWAFDHLGWDRVIHCIDPLNAPSQAVARKLGARNLGRGVLPPPFHEATIDIWGQSRSEWRTRHAAHP